MMHLAEVHGYVHGDLAARNCLVRHSGDSIEVKVNDFGVLILLTAALTVV